MGSFTSALSGCVFGSRGCVRSDGRCCVSRHGFVLSRLGSVGDVRMCSASAGFVLVELGSGETGRVGIRLLERKGVLVESTSGFVKLSSECVEVTVGSRGRGRLLVERVGGLLNSWCRVL